jgi:hypothetical protein
MRTSNPKWIYSTAVYHIQKDSKVAELEENCAPSMRVVICGLFNNTFIIKTILLHMVGWLMNAELERIWKETVSNLRE